VITLIDEGDQIARMTYGLMQRLDKSRGAPIGDDD
jgi:hypothetical protein